MEGFPKSSHIYLFFNSRPAESEEKQKVNLVWLTFDIQFDMVLFRSCLSKLNTVNFGYQVHPGIKCTLFITCMLSSRYKLLFIKRMRLIGVVFYD